jgi:hypothetical protein
MLRITDETKNDKPGLADCLAHRCEAHRSVPARLEDYQGAKLEAECGECLAVALTYQYALGVEDEKHDILDGYAAALTVGAARNRALWTMAAQVYAMIDRIRLHDAGWAEREYQTMINEGALPPDRDIVTMMMRTRYTVEEPRG